MQVREVMTRDVITVAPDTPVKEVGELLAGWGFAAVPVVDEDDVLVGLVAEADILRGRVPHDPRLHLRRDAAADAVVPAPPDTARGVMATHVRSVDVTADVSDVAALLLGEKLRSVPVLDGQKLAGIVSRRDLLRALVRSDTDIARDLLRLVEEYTGEPGNFTVTVVEGSATIRRTAGHPDGSPDAEFRALQALGRTVGGVVTVAVTGAGYAGEPTTDST
ncbi:MAG: CBS domain-containing protein [Blastococcus sp.]